MRPIGAVVACHLCFFGATGDHIRFGANQFGNLQRRRIDPTASAHNQNSFTGAQVAGYHQVVPGSEIDQRSGRCLLHIITSRHGDQIARRDSHILGTSATRIFTQNIKVFTALLLTPNTGSTVAAPKQRIGRHLLAHCPPFDSRAHFSNFAAKISTGNVREGQAQALPADADKVVQPVERSILYPHQNLIGPNGGRRQIRDHLVNIKRWAVFIKTNPAHGATPLCYVGPGKFVAILYSMVGQATKKGISMVH